MNASSILGRREDIKAILDSLRISEKDKPKQPIVPCGIDFTTNDMLEWASQQWWVEHFNKTWGVMASLPDFYLAGKNGDEPLLEGLRKTLEGNTLTGTKIIYQPNTLQGKIIHYQGSKVVSPIEKNVIIPVYKFSLVSDILTTSDGLVFMQAIFATEDGSEAITKTLERLSKRKADKTTVSTPPQEEREERPERETLIQGYLDKFFNWHVLCNSGVNDSLGYAKGADV